MTYTIEQVEGKREGFSEYRYRILGDGQLVAYYWHDYRGDEHGIEFVGGGTELWPVGRMIDFLKGGGPEPLELSARAVAYLHAKTKDENP